jgi:hypothetical protein
MDQVNHINKTKLLQVRKLSNAQQVLIMVISKVKPKYLLPVHIVRGLAQVCPSECPICPLLEDGHPQGLAITQGL